MFNSILTWIVGIAATIAIIAMVIFLIKDVISFLQGQGTSLMKILGKVGAIILIVAIMFLAKNFATNGQTIADGVGSNVVDQGIEELNNAVP